MVSQHRENATLSKQPASFVSVALSVHYVANGHHGIYVQRGKVAQDCGKPLILTMDISDDSNLTEAGRSIRLSRTHHLLAACSAIRT